MRAAVSGLKSNSPSVRSSLRPKTPCRAFGKACYEIATLGGNVGKPKTGIDWGNRVNRLQAERRSKSGPDDDLSCTIHCKMVEKQIQEQ